MPAPRTHLRLRRALAGLAATLGLAAPFACTPSVTAEPLPRCRDCNLVLVSIDTLRADHVGCYGYERDTMPNTCAFFADGIRFANAMSQAPWTAPAHASMFTGRLPAAHGVVDGPAPSPLDPSVQSLFGILRERGYWTMAVHGGGYLDAALPKTHLDLEEGIALLRQRAAQRAVREALRSVPDGRRFVLFVHAYDPHTHYKPRENHFAERDPEIDRKAYDEGVCEFEDLPDGSRRLDPARIPRDPATWAYIETLYDSEVYEADVALGRLYGWLEEDGVLGNTVVAFTSDHGEEFFDHGSCEHVKTLYDELLHVPLLLRWPGVPARVDTRRVPASTGLAPTLLDALGIDPAPFGFDAPSLLDPSVDPGPVLAETRFHYDGRRLRLAAASSARAKLVRDGDGPIAAWDLAADPREQTPLASPAAGALAPRVLAPLRAALDRYAQAMDAGDRERKAGSTSDLDCATVSQLRELGYVGSEVERERCPE